MIRLRATMAWRRLLLRLRITKPTEVVRTDADRERMTANVLRELDRRRVVREWQEIRDDATVRMKVLHTDEALRDKGDLYEADGMALCSSIHPAIHASWVYVWGRNRSLDSGIESLPFASPAVALEYRTRVADLIAGFNASKRAPSSPSSPSCPVSPHSTSHHIPGYTPASAWGKPCW